MTTQTVNPGVTTFIVIRCICGKPQGPAVEIGARVQFTCSDRGCKRWNDQIAR